MAWREDDNVFLTGSRDGALRLRQIDSPHSTKLQVDSSPNLPADPTDFAIADESENRVETGHRSATSESESAADVAGANQPVVDRLTLGWRLAGVLLVTPAITLTGCLAGLASAAIAVQFRIFHGLMTLEPVYAMRGFWSGAIYRVSDTWTMTGSMAGTMMGFPAGILIAHRLFVDDWSAALVRSRASMAAGWGVIGALLLAVPLLPIMAITFYFRDHTVFTWLNLPLLVPMLTTGAVVLPCWIAGGMHGAILAGRTEHCVGRQRWALLLSIEERTTRQTRTRSRLRAAVWIGGFLALMILLISGTAGRFDLGGTADGQGAASRDSVDDPNFVLVDEIANDYRTRPDYANSRYGNYHFQFKGFLKSLTDDEVTLADDSGRLAIRCQLLSDEERRHQIKRNRWLTEDYRFVALRIGDPVVMFGHCRGLDADGVVLCEEAGFHRWSMEHGATDPGD